MAETGKTTLEIVLPERQSRLMTIDADYHSGVSGVVGQATKIGSFGRKLMNEILEEVGNNPKAMTLVQKSAFAEKCMKIELDSYETARRCMAEEKKENNTPEAKFGRYVLGIFDSAVGMESLASVIFSTYDYVNRDPSEVREAMETEGNMEGVWVFDMMHKKIYGKKTQTE